MRVVATAFITALISLCAPPTIHAGEAGLVDVSGPVSMSVSAGDMVQADLRMRTDLAVKLFVLRDGRRWPLSFAREGVGTRGGALAGPMPRDGVVFFLIEADGESYRSNQTEGAVRWLRHPGSGAVLACLETGGTPDFDDLVVAFHRRSAAVWLPEPSWPGGGAISEDVEVAIDLPLGDAWQTLMDDAPPFTEVPSLNWGGTSPRWTGGLELYLAGVRPGGDRWERPLSYTLNREARAVRAIVSFPAPRQAGAGGEMRFLARRTLSYSQPVDGGEALSVTAPYRAVSPPVTGLRIVDATVPSLIVSLEARDGSRPSRLRVLTRAPPDETDKAVVVDLEGPGFVRARRTPVFLYTATREPPPGGHRVQGYRPLEDALGGGFFVSERTRIFFKVMARDNGLLPPEGPSKVGQEEQLGVNRFDLRRFTTDYYAGFEPPHLPLATGDGPGVRWQLVQGVSRTPLGELNALEHVFEAANHAGGEGPPLWLRVTARDEAGNTLELDVPIRVVPKGASMADAKATPPAW